MALTVETGSKVAGANSYSDVPDFEAFCTSIGVTLTGNNGTAAQVLLKAFMGMEQSSYIGSPTYTDRPRPQWPRTGVYINDAPVGSTEIPDQLREFQWYWAIEIDAGRDPSGVISRAVKREKVDVIETEYMDNAAPFEISRIISGYKAMLTRASTGGLTFKVDRG